MAPAPRVLITGATDGLGRALAARLGAEGARLLLHGRDPEKLTQVAAEIAERGGPEPQTFVADLAELRQVRSLAGEVKASTDRLDVLISNAGIGSGLPDSRERQVSIDGYELRFAVNYLAGLLLTRELLELLTRSAPARIVWVASLGQHPIDFEDVMLEREYSGPRAYAQSKLAQIMTGLELAAQLPADQVTVNSLHPGTYMPTKIVLSEIGRNVDSLEQGVEATRRLAVAEDVAGLTGRFFNGLDEARANAQADDLQARRRLWELSLELLDSSRA